MGSSLQRRNFCSRPIRIWWLSSVAMYSNRLVVIGSSAITPLSETSALLSSDKPRASRDDAMSLTRIWISSESLDWSIHDGLSREEVGCGVSRGIPSESSRFEELSPADVRDLVSPDEEEAEAVFALVVLIDSGIGEGEAALGSSIVTVLA